MRPRCPKVLHPLLRPADAGLRPRRLGEHRRRPAGAPPSSSTRRRSRRSARPSPTGADFALQDEPRGTGDAVRAALAPSRTTPTEILVLSGDVPLLTGADLEAVLEARRAGRRRDRAASVYAADPGRLGRVVRGDFGTVERIVEAKDATPEELDRQRDQRRAVRVRRRLAAPADRRPRAVGRDRRAVPDRPRPARPRGRPDRGRGRLRGRRAVRRHQRPRPARRAPSGACASGSTRPTCATA